MTEPIFSLSQAPAFPISARDILLLHRTSNNVINSYSKGSEALLSGACIVHYFSICFDARDEYYSSSLLERLNGGKIYEPFPLQELCLHLNFYFLINTHILRNCLSFRVSFPTKMLIKNEKHNRLRKLLEIKSRELKASSMNGYSLANRSLRQ